MKMHTRAAVGLLDLKFERKKRFKMIQRSLHYTPANVLQEALKN